MAGLFSKPSPGGVRKALCLQLQFHAEKRRFRFFCFFCFAVCFTVCLLCSCDHTQGLEIKESDGKGYGLFATEEWLPDQVITRFGTTDDDSRGAAAVGAPSCRLDRDDFVLEASASLCKPGHWAHFVNEGFGAEINATMCDDNKGWLIRASKQVHAGEEFLCSYGKERTNLCKRRKL